MTSTITSLVLSVVGAVVKITDKYKTPNGYYVVAKNETIALIEYGYNKIEKGDYATITHTVYYDMKFNPLYTIDKNVKNLTPVSEAESGYRDACEVVK